MGSDDGAGSGSASHLEPVVSDSEKEAVNKKTIDQSRIKADFHATIESLIGGQEIIKVAHRSPHLDKGNSKYLKLQQLLNDQGVIGEAELPGWLLKVYENLQLEEDQRRVHTSWLLQHFTDEGISSEQNQDFSHSSQSTKNSDANSEKIHINEIIKLIDNFLNLKKFDTNSKFVKSLQVSMLEQKLDDTLVKLKFILTNKPNDWNEMYLNYVSTAKNIINKLEESFKLAEAGLLKEPDFDIKINPAKVFGVKGWENLQHFKQSLRKWDSIEKVIWETKKFSSRNDDIIIVEKMHEKSSSDGKDEL